MWTTPAHYRLSDTDGGMFPWPARDTLDRRTYVDGTTTLVRLDKDRYMACDAGSVRAFIHIPDSEVTMTREHNGELE